MRIVPLVVLGAAVLAPAAQAQVITEAESPRSGAVRLSLGPYNPGPSIDSEAGLATAPYQDTFGSSKMLLFEVKYERYFLQSFGALGAGLSLGYAEKYGRATVVDDPAAETSEGTVLQVVPAKLFALYNFDIPALQWRIPLVPYLKGGVAWVGWRSTKGGKVETVDGDKAQGGKWGLTAAGGLAFMLDVLEPRLSRDFDSEVGINHTYLFAEYELLQTGIFGGGGLNLSSRHFVFGLALEF